VISIDTENFEDLGISKDQNEQQVNELNVLIAELAAKSPKMLENIFENCQWLADHGIRSDFVFEVAQYRMSMELAEVFKDLPPELKPAFTFNE
jgi:hypothetical protein